MSHRPSSAGAPGRRPLVQAAAALALGTLLPRPALAAVSGLVMIGSRAL